MISPRTRHIADALMQHAFLASTPVTVFVSEEQARMLLTPQRRTVLASRMRSTAGAEHDRLAFLLQRDASLKESLGVHHNSELRVRVTPDLLQMIVDVRKVYPRAGTWKVADVKIKGRTLIESGFGVHDYAYPGIEVYEPPMHRSPLAAWRALWRRLEGGQC